MADQNEQATSPNPQPKTKVLVAEDNPVVRRGLQNFLVKWGYEPVECADGKEAWKKLLADPAIRLAILDWNLPELTGMQLCRALRAKRPDPHVYLMIFSSRSSTEEQVAALENGADGYLVKPVKPSLLKAHLGAACRLVARMG